MTRIFLKNVTLTMPFIAAKVPLKSGELDPRIHYFSGKPRSFAALQGLDLTVEAGDRLGIVGQNGCGKTTLLRVIGGIFRPSFGEVHIKGRMESLFQVGLGMRMDLSGIDNVRLRGRLLGLRGKALADYMERAVAFANIGPFINMPMRTYSQGMSMRVMFAASTEGTPDILLLDEWLGAGDASFAQRANQRMRGFVERSGIVMIASHSDSLLQSVCNKIMWMEMGRVRKIGPTKEILDEYRQFMKQRSTASVSQKVVSIK